MKSGWIARPKLYHLDLFMRRGVTGCRVMSKRMWGVMSNGHNGEEDGKLCEL